MRIDGEHTRLSASDLSNFLACRHLTQLDVAKVQGKLEPAIAYDLGLEKLIERGEAHEATILSGFRSLGLEVVEIEHLDGVDTAQQTRDAITSGVSVIYQGVLLREDENGASLLGRPDFLVRPGVVSGVEGDETLGYEVVDAKLARTAKARAVLQVAFYSALLAEVQGFAPASMHLALGNTSYASFRFADFAAYERRMRALLTSTVADQVDPSLDTYPEPVEHCAICRWSTDCDRKRRDDDDLSLVAGMPTSQRIALKQVGIATRRDFAATTPLPRLRRRNGSSLEGAQLQARLQVASEDAGSTQYELLEPERDEEGSLVPNRGLLALPEPSDGDLFFDIEGARYYSEDAQEFGLQYLFGIVDTAALDADGNPTYRQIWAFDRRDEKRAFQELVDFITERRQLHPGLHVYHYNHYEPTSVEHLSAFHGTHEEAVGHLMGRFATREDDVDDLFRGGVFVDLYRVVRQGLRVGVESYSLKRLEPLIGYERAVSLRDATLHLISFEADLEAGTASESAESRAVVAGYNEDDCRATLALRDWLEEQRYDLADRTGGALPRPVFDEEAQDTEDPEIVALKLALTDGVPEDPALRDEIDNARVLLADLLEWHRRDAKPAWWRFFHCHGLSSEDLVFESDAIGELSGGDVVGHVAQSVVRRFTLPAQEHGFRVDKSARDPVHDKTWTVVALDPALGTIDLKIRRSNDSESALPTQLIEMGPRKELVLAATLRRLAERAVAGDLGALRRTCADAALLLRDPPHGSTGPLSPLRHVGESPTASATRIVGALDASYLSVQGPPGTGKTYLGAAAILEAIGSGKTVGITAPSHAVIHNLLSEVMNQADSGSLKPRIGQKPADGDTWLHDDARSLSNETMIKALRSKELDIAAGTAWMWAREEFHQAVDVLFVDEAGQMSLANTLAAAQGARSVVLLGDPQQLAQPSQGSHPPGSDVSALEHVLGHHATMPDEMGLFLDRTYRMHPSLCAFTSDAFYEGRLTGVPGLEHQRIDGLAELTAGAGLRVLEVPHAGNTNASAEEAREVTRLVTELLGSEWTNQHGKRCAMTSDDVLVVTPFNAQIGEIERALADAGVTGIRVGTVDKFQGREAPAVIYSMATSSPEDAPRGMEFLFDLHRLNVATSRARSIGIIVASPELTRAFCRTPRQMHLANALCLAWEY